jgi:hypothetical protein
MNKGRRNFLPSDVFACGSSTSRAMGKWMVQADSAHQIGLKTTSPRCSDYRLVMVKKLLGGIFPGGICYVLASTSTIGGLMDKWMLQVRKVRK